MKNPKFNRLLTFLILLLGGLLAAAPLAVPGLAEISRFCVCAGCLIAGFGILYGALTVRCPHCNRPLPLFGPQKDACPQCGQKFI